MMRATQQRTCLVAILIGLFAAACSTQRERVDPAVARYSIAALLPAGVPDAQGWAEDMRAAFDALEIKPTAQNICAVIAVTQQESTFQANPAVPGLPQIARREIDARAARYRIPKFMVRAALRVASPSGLTFEQRLARVRTEQELSELFEDFIGMVPLGRQLFGGLNPVRTGGPMQVSIAFAEAHASEHRYPYDPSPNVRREVFTRRGGLYFGIAHLLGYPVSYDRMLHRFADFNAGRYASRNAAFQSAVATLAKTPLALDGDLVVHGDDERVSKTEAAVRQLGKRLELDEAQIHQDLLLSGAEKFEDTDVYRRVFALIDEVQGRPAPRAVIPRIKLESAKITRNLTTSWFAERVDQRYRACLARGSAPA